MKQTAVEWFAKELYEKFEMKGDGILFDEFLKQAKELEKQQMIEMHDKGFDSVEQLNDEFAIEFAEWMAKEYWLNSSGKYMKGQTHKELLEIYKKEKEL